MGPSDLPHTTFEFLQRDYELKINYLCDHFSRMWTRFNFFIVMESALSGALFALSKNSGNPSKGAAFLIILIGVLSTLCWYVFGAQDRYLVEIYRKHVADAGSTIAAKLELRDYLGSDYVHVGDTRAKVKQSLYQWRFEPISTTKLAALFPLLVLVYWVAVTWVVTCG